MSVVQEPCFGVKADSIVLPGGKGYCGRER